MTLVGPLVLVAVLFPYSAVLPLELYNQPWPLLIAVASLPGALLEAKRRGDGGLRRSDRAWVLWITAVGLGLFMACAAGTPGLQEFKYLIAFLAPAVYLPTLALMVRYRATATRRIIQTSLLVWFSVSVVQALFDPSFMSFVLGRWSEVAIDVAESGRGTIGLAPEPWYHAGHVIMITAAAAMLGSRWPWIALGIVDVLLLARSSGGTACVVAGVLASVACSRWSGRKSLIAISVAVAILILTWLVAEVDREGRFGGLVGGMLSDPVELLRSDYSMNARLSGLYSAIVLPVHSYGMPAGMNHEAWLRARESMLASNPWMIDLSLVGPASGLGALAFQGGILVLPALGTVALRILWVRSGIMARSLACASLAVVCCQYSVASGAFWLVYACACEAPDAVSKFRSATAPRIPEKRNRHG